MTSSGTQDHSIVFSNGASPATLAADDWFIAAIGFEERSRWIAAEAWNRSLNGLAIGFGSREELNFEQNRLFFDSSGLTFMRIVDSDFPAWTTGPFRTELDSHRRVHMDISSFSRERLGYLMLEFWDWLRSGDRELTLWYAPARFEDSVTKFANSGVGIADLLPGFEGNWVDPDVHVTTIIGLGFEVGRAVGALELLEANRVVACRPTGVSPMYDHKCLRLNRPVVNAKRAVDYPYDVTDPSGLLDGLLSVTRDALRRGRCVLLPLGPKVFATAAILASLDIGAGIPIWRVSGGSTEMAQDVVASGRIVSLKLTSGPRLEADDRQVLRHAQAGTLI